MARRLRTKHNTCSVMAGRMDWATFSALQTMSVGSHFWSHGAFSDSHIMANK